MPPPRAGDLLLNRDRPFHVCVVGAVISVGTSLGECEVELVSLVAGDVLGLGVERGGVVRGHGVRTALVVVKLPFDGVADLGGSGGGDVLSGVGGVVLHLDRERGFGVWRGASTPTASGAVAAAAAGRQCDGQKAHAEHA